MIYENITFQSHYRFQPPDVSNLILRRVLCHTPDGFCQYLRIIVYLNFTQLQFFYQIHALSDEKVLGLLLIFFAFSLLLFQCDKFCCASNTDTKLMFVAGLSAFTFLIRVFCSSAPHMRCFSGYHIPSHSHQSIPSLLGWHHSLLMAGGLGI